MTSNAAVFWPAMRCGLTELTRVSGWPRAVPWSAISRTMRRASSKLPSMADDTRAGHLRLEQLAGRDAPGRQDDDDLQASRRAVGRCRGGGVAGRGADDRPGARLECLGHGHDHAAVLERARRVGALDLEVELRDAELAAEVAGMDEGRGPFAQRERRGGVGQGQEGRVPVEEPRARAGCGLLLSQVPEHLARPHAADRTSGQGAHGAVWRCGASRRGWLVLRSASRVPPRAVRRPAPSSRSSARRRPARRAPSAWCRRRVPSRGAAGGGRGHPAGPRPGAWRPS